MSSYILVLKSLEPRNLTNAKLLFTQESKLGLSNWRFIWGPYGAT